ncbi:MAG: protein kinase, partial [Candidatus Hydrogenedentes bacterium]|nr:protein kinase [Candidatus Hydrogenedentota bacterium]
MAEPTMPKKLGRYEIIRELGKGAMGVVYEGKDPNIGRRVAIKTARRDVMEASGMADEMMERFLREAQAAGALNHPNIITIYDAAEEDGMAYIAMEFLEGGDLGDMLEAKQKLSMERIVEIGAHICEALEVAHANGVVHRDIKPANILMPTGKPLKVADFGIAHVSDSNLTQDGALIGTPHYMSPEQFMGQKLDGRSDLFSVGNILYELCTGEKPFSGEALSTVMHHVIKIDPVNPTELNFAVPDALAQVIMTALSKRPANRYASGNVMASALRESLKDNPDPAKLVPSNAALGATLATGAAPAPQATIVTGAPAGDATIPGGAAPIQESTIAGNPPAPEATIPGGTPAPATTAAGGAPPVVESSQELASPVPGAPPVPEAIADTPAGAVGNKGLMIGGGVAAAVLVVIVAAFSLFGGDSSESTTTTGANGATAAVSHPYYGSAGL